MVRRVLTLLGLALALSACGVPDEIGANAKQIFIENQIADDADPQFVQEPSCKSAGDDRYSCVIYYDRPDSPIGRWGYRYEIEHYPDSGDVIVVDREPVE